jgi:hypothetical protein
MWIIMAWHHFSPELTVKGFKKCCLSSAVDGTDDEMAWKDSEEEGDVRSNCEEEEDTDW